MNVLELRHLKRICDKYGLDCAEIDNTLTYAENKKHLLSLARMIAHNAWELERYAELQTQYMKEHFLSYYVIYQLAGETKSTEVGQSYSPRFSLQEYIQSRVS